MLLSNQLKKKEMKSQTCLHIPGGKWHLSTVQEAVLKIAVLLLATAYPFMGFAASIKEQKAVDTSCTLPGPQSACVEIVQHLPWKLTPLYQEVTEGVKITYVAAGHSAGSKEIPRLTLDVVNHGNLENAKAELLTRLAESNPDIGISYAWDFALVRGPYLYFLHAECSLAETHVMSVIEKLRRVEDTRKNDSPGPAFLCRCGNPCRMLR